MIDSETHHVRSNRESGYGRAGVLITSKTGKGPGAVMELKIIATDKGEAPELLLALAAVRTFVPTSVCCFSTRPHPNNCPESFVSCGWP